MKASCPVLTIPPISEPYHPAVGAFAQTLRDLSVHEEGDPKKVAQVVVDLAGRSGPRFGSSLPL
jgi:hypothetical protein